MTGQSRGQDEYLEERRAVRPWAIGEQRARPMQGSAAARSLMLSPADTRDEPRSEE